VERGDNRDGALLEERDLLRRAQLRPAQRADVAVHVRVLDVAVLGLRLVLQRENSLVGVDGDELAVLSVAVEQLEISRHEREAHLLVLRRVEEALFERRQFRRSTVAQRDGKIEINEGVHGLAVEQAQRGEDARHILLVHGVVQLGRVLRRRARGGREGHAQRVGGENQLAQFVAELAQMLQLVHAEDGGA